jgi:acyl-CoA thioesterase-2
MAAEELVAETIEVLSVRPEGDGFVGDAPEWFGPVLFGGFTIAQAANAVSRTAPDGRRLTSLHAYFLRPVLAGRPLRYSVDTVREGRTLAIRRLEAVQEGKAVLDLTGVFAEDEPGDEYELRVLDDLPPPDELPTEVGPGPWEQVDLGPTPAGPDGARRSTLRMWTRIPTSLPDDPHLHVALVGMVTDMTGTSGRPLDLARPIDEGMISLCHAAWFHRPVRADQWLHFDVHALVQTGGRSFLRGTIHDGDGRLAVSMAQEMLLRS